VSICPQYFPQHGVFPLLRALGTSRAELIKAYRRAQAERGAKEAKDDIPVERGTAELAMVGA